MHIAIAKLEGTTPLSFSRNIDPLEHPKKSKELPDAYDERVWRLRMHSTSDGHVVIPRSFFERTIMGAARRLQLQVPGKGKTQFTKYFEAGINVADDVVLPDLVSEVRGERLHVPADGKPGGGKRVYRRFPVIDRWAGEIQVYILDDVITESVFTQVLRSAGLLVGIGRFRPENRGYYGRFSVLSVKWIEEGDAAIAAAAE